LSLISQLKLVNSLKDPYCGNFYICLDKYTPN